MRELLVFSGGMDSTALAYHLLGFGREVRLVSFDYGQRHQRELLYAKKTAKKLGLEHDVVGLQTLRTHLTGSALTDDSIDVPEGHYEAESMKSTVVPNRNMIMLAVAAGIAQAEGFESVATAVHSGDHAIYADCRPEFIGATNTAVQASTEGAVRVSAPFIGYLKEDIVRAGEAAGVPWEDTWSCYKGGVQHCGKCGTCVERIEAFQLAGVTDLTEYLL